ncbi:OLC1v1028910C1 [Oldenlandia corymbosa var. corymbosa]|uniref:OLC1v1028910C1 n=1 Tax=Oldenlandia corymbosa var. corymbosa TaxID=529605 RepID=A0AAV1CD83_OLDCO|nr:OLC1v1028910C1 [Oldenlandia corymbosa var. corymbosa]
MKRGDRTANQAVGNNRRRRNAGVVIHEPDQNIIANNIANIPDDVIPNIVDNDGNNNNNNGGGNIAYQRDPGHLMPVANISRIMQKILPSHAKISNDSKEFIQACTSEFIRFITAEAKERSRRDCRKTISAEDVLYSLHHQGFHNYVDPLTLYLNKYRQSETARTVMRGNPSVRRTTDFSTIVQQSTAAPPLPPPLPQHVPPPYMPNMIPAASSYENYLQHGLYGQVPTSSYHYHDSGASSSDTTHGQEKSSMNSSLAPFHSFSRGSDPSS